MQIAEIEKISLEEYGERGRLLREVLDSAQWALGDLVMEVVTAYGLGAVDEFAKDVGIARSTAYEYKALCAFYEQSARVDFLDRWRGDEETPKVTYSHFRVAKRLNSVVLAYELLELAALNAWSVDQTEYHMYQDEPFKSVMADDDEDEDDSEPEPTPIMTSVPVVIDEIDRKANLVTFHIADSYLDMLAEEKGDEFLLTLTRR